MGQTRWVTPEQASISDAQRGVRRAHYGMLFWALIVGMSFPAVGMMSEGLPPLLLTAIRFAIAALAVWPLVWRTPDHMPSLRGLALYAFMGLSLAGFFGTMFWAAHRTSALSMATLYVSVPLLAYYLGRLFGVEQRAVQLLES
jgi:drug/metabolite transporter (DMT)-like permease